MVNSENASRIPKPNGIFAWLITSIKAAVCSTLSDYCSEPTVSAGNFALSGRMLKNFRRQGSQRSAGKPRVLPTGDNNPVTCSGEIRLSSKLLQVGQCANRRSRTGKVRARKRVSQDWHRQGSDPVTPNRKSNAERRRERRMFSERQEGQFIVTYTNRMVRIS